MEATLSKLSEQEVLLFEQLAETAKRNNALLEMLLERQAESTKRQEGAEGGRLSDVWKELGHGDSDTEQWRVYLVIDSNYLNAEARREAGSDAGCGSMRPSHKIVVLCVRQRKNAARRRVSCNSPGCSPMQPARLRR